MKGIARRHWGDAVWEWQGFSYPSRVKGKGTWGSGWGSSCLDPHTPVPLNRG